MDEATRQITLPITGMTCANCVATIERNLKRLDGVTQAAVNLASERATVEFDPARLDTQGILARVRRAGYDVALGDADWPLRRLADERCIRASRHSREHLPCPHRYSSA